MDFLNVVATFSADVRTINWVIDHLTMAKELLFV